MINSSLPEVQGIRLPKGAWGPFVLERVLQYYDGPRLLLRKSVSEQLSLSWWCDRDANVERWIHLPVSEERLRVILSGEMTSYDGLLHPEEGCLVVVDLDSEGMPASQFIVEDVRALPPESVPHQNLRLNVPVPEEVSGLALREGVHQLDFRMRSLSEEHAGRFGAKVVGQIIGNFQRLIDSLGHAKRTRSKSTKGSIPGSILGWTRLDLVEVYSGSLGIRFESSMQDDLFGESLTRDSLEVLFDLVQVGGDADGLTDHLQDLTPRVAKRYADFLSTIEASAADATLKWSRPRIVRPRWIHITNKLAREARAQILAVQDSLGDTVSIEGRFVGGSVRTLRFEIEESETGDRFSGQINEAAIPNVEQIRLGSPCRATLLPQLSVNEVTGEEETAYTLIEIDSIQSGQSSMLL